MEEMPAKRGDAMTDTTAATAPAANPAALGLVGFGMTTVLLSSINAGLLPAGGEGVVIPMALAYGGLIQLIAGLLEFKLGNTFGMTAFLSYGAFWWWFALLILLGGVKVLDISGAGSAIGVCLLLWGVFTFGLWISTFRLSRLLFCIFLTLWIAFFLLGGGAVLGNADLHRLGGWVGLLCGALAMYGSFALVTNATYGREVIPVGNR
jgi:succinate-acetate transporter protein